MAKLRVATIGGGSIAQELHLPGYHKNPHAVIVAVTDPDPARWKEIREQFGVERFYKDYREMLDKESLDAVSVCSPNSLSRRAGRRGHRQAAFTSSAKSR